MGLSYVPETPNIMGLSCVPEIPNIMGLSYVESLKGAFLCTLHPLYIRWITRFTGLISRIRTYI